MQPAAYNQLVSRLEGLARTDPRSLRSKVRYLITLGYLYVFTVLLAIVAAFAGIVFLVVETNSGGLAVKLLIALLVVGWMIVKSLWVSTPPPQGQPLPGGAAPALDARIEEIRKALDAPRVDTVLLTDDFNAAVTQIPRLGIFGFPRTYLILGVPLMYALGRREFDAVLAHEFAHLSGSHPKLGLWVYRMSRTWQALLVHLHTSRSWGRHLFEKFVDWYAPRLQAYGFVMSRRDEYEADSDAASVAGADAMAGALVAMSVRGQSIVKLFWEDVWRRVETDIAPPARTWTMFPQAVRATVPEPLKAEWIAKALSGRSLDDDTHPSTRERVEALGVIDGPQSGGVDTASDLLAPLEQSAAEHYLVELGPRILEGLEESWHEAVREGWSARHNHISALRPRADALIARDIAGETLEDVELWELAGALADLDGDRAAIPYLRRVVAVMPDNAAASFILGRALLADEDADGVGYVHAAMARDLEAVPAGTALLREYYANRADERGIMEMQQVEYDHNLVMRAAAAERGDVRTADELVAADLLEADQAHLRDLASQDARVVRMWVARKVTQLLPERPMIVILLEPKWWRLGSWTSRDQHLAQEFIGRVTLSVPADTLVIVLSTASKWLWKKLKKLPGSEIYPN